MPTWTGAVSTDWNTAGNWVTPSAVPTSTTDAIFIGTPVRNCTTGTAARLCLNLVTTGYLGTLEVGSSTAGYLRVLGNITLGSTAGHITATGLAYIGIEGTTCALDVASGFTVPYLAFGALTVAGSTGGPSGRGARSVSDALRGSRRGRSDPAADFGPRRPFGASPSLPVARFGPRSRRSGFDLGAVGRTRARTRASPRVRPNKPGFGSSRTSNSASSSETPN